MFLVFNQPHSLCLRLRDPGFSLCRCDFSGRLVSFCVPEPFMRNGRPPTSHSMHSFLHQYTGSFKKPPLRRPHSVIGGTLGSFMAMPRNGSRLGETRERGEAGGGKRVILLSRRPGGMAGLQKGDGWMWDWVRRDALSCRLIHQSRSVAARNYQMNQISRKWGLGAAQGGVRGI